MRISDWSSDVFSSDLIGLWKRVATLLQGQHNLTCAQTDHEIREVVDCRTVNGFGDDLRPIIHCNVAHDGKAAAPAVGPPADPLGTWSRPQPDPTALEGFAADKMAQENPYEAEQKKRKGHPETRNGPPQG